MIHTILYPDDKTAGIVIMVKAPRPGTVKTRLLGYLTPGDAAEFAACGLRDVVKAAQTLTPHIAIAYAPRDGQHDLQNMLDGDFAWIPQQGVDLGARMHNAVVGACAQGMGPVLVLGTDSPTLPRDALADAFALLKNHDIVLAPAEDGGYWCVGLRQPVAGLFDNITWSTETVFEQTVANARHLGLTVALVAVWYDVDTPADVMRLENDPFLSVRAPETAAWLLRRRAGTDIGEAAFEDSRGNAETVA